MPASHNRDVAQSSYGEPHWLPVWLLNSEIDVFLIALPYILAPEGRSNRLANRDDRR